MVIAPVSTLLGHGSPRVASESGTAAFLAALGEIQYLPPGDERLAAYADPYSFDEAHAAPPEAVVLPTSVEQVQAVLRAASVANVTIWPVSTGRNLGYGGGAALGRSTVVIDLHLMNRVLEVDVSAGTTLVEPGVTFLDLYDHLQDNNIPLWTSVPDIGWGSVVGNALERGFGYTAHGEHAAFRCGVEAVLADGTLLRTGMGAVSGGASFSQYRGGSGPALDGLFQQSKLGVVTKMGVWLMPRPEVAVSVTVSVAENQLLAPLIDALHPLMLDDTIPGTVMIGNVLAIASATTPRSVWSDRPDLLEESDRRSVIDRFGVVGGTRDSASTDRRQWSRPGWPPSGRRWRTSRDAPSSSGVTQVPSRCRRLTRPIGRSWESPSLDLLQMAGWRGGEHAHAHFSLVCPPDGATAARQVELVRGMVESAGFDHVGGITLFKRHGIALTLMSFDRADGLQRNVIAELFPRLIAAARMQGWAPYRAHLALMGLVAEQFDFADHALLRTQRRIKAALDPAGILAPGKQGV